jgi:hypothetical protein
MLFSYSQLRPFDKGSSGNENSSNSKRIPAIEDIQKLKYTEKVLAKNLAVN